jgi:hypothetical protein
MRINKSNPKAQSIVEYVAVILLVIGVLIVVGVYFKRSLQGKYKESGDVFGGGEQYTHAY